MPEATPAPASGATATSSTQAAVKPLNGANGNGKTTKAPDAGAASATKTPAKAETTSTGVDEWSDEHEKSLVDLLKRKSKADPRFRTRVKGEERGIESAEDLASLFDFAQRGRAATKTVEETKAQAAKLAEEKKAIDEARSAFESGDLNAIERAMRALAGERAPQVVRALTERDAMRAQALEQLTPTERQLLQDRETLEAELSSFREQQKKSLEASKKAEADKQLSELRREAADRGTHILTTLKLPPEKLDVLGPHLVGAMREAAEVGLELGRDVAPEQLLEYATQRATEASTGFFTGLTAPQQYEALGEETVAGLVREYLQRAKLKKAAPVDAAGKPKPRESQAKALPVLGTAAYFARRR